MEHDDIVECASTRLHCTAVWIEFIVWCVWTIPHQIIHPDVAHRLGTQHVCARQTTSLNLYHKTFSVDDTHDVHACRAPLRVEPVDHHTHSTYLSPVRLCVVPVRTPTLLQLVRPEIPTSVGSRFFV